MAKRKIPPINYVILFGIFVLVICACFAANNLYNVIRENRISTSPLATKQVLYEDLRNTTQEINADTFLIISYVQDDEVHENEVEIERTLNRHNLMDNVMYLDVTDYKNDASFCADLNDLLDLSGNLEITNFPAVVFYKDGVPTYTTDSTDHLLNAGDFEQIIDMYDLAS